jgi:hypothetical protein
MAERYERIFENKKNWGHGIGTTEIGQESRTFHIKEWWIVKNGPKQLTVMMFDNY